MGKVISLFDNKVKDTGLELVSSVQYSNQLGTEMFVLCKDSCKRTSAYSGHFNETKSKRDNEMLIAKFGKKLTLKDADRIFGDIGNYKYA